MAKQKSRKVEPAEVSKLASYLASEGWIVQAAKGAYEETRFAKPGSKEPLIIWKDSKGFFKVEAKWKEIVSSAGI